MPRKTIYETIFKGVIFGSFFGIAYFAVDGLLKLADDQQELLREMKKNFRNAKRPLIEKIIFHYIQHV